MEFLVFEPCWEYMALVTLVFVALVVWTKDVEIPRPNKDCLNESVWTRVRKTLSLRG